MPKGTTLASLEPLSGPLPAEIATTLGSIVARHAYLDWLLGQVMYSLMEISIKQGRVIMKLPRPRVYIAAVTELLDFHGLKTKYDFDDLAEKLEAADRTRRELTRSVYMRDPDRKGAPIHLARSHWDPGPGGEVQPELEELSKKFLTKRRRDVEAAIECAEVLMEVTNKKLRTAHKQRHTKPAR